MSRRTVGAPMCGKALEMSGWIGTERKTEKCEVGWVTLFGVVRYRRAMSGDVGLGLRGPEGGGMGAESMDGLILVDCECGVMVMMLVSIGR